MVCEVPVRRPRAPGSYKLNGNGTELSFKLNVANIDNVVMAHIHLGPAGENGPIVAFLYGPGGAYTNVHTNDGVDPANTGPGDFPGGEIRGQISEKGPS